MEIRNSEDKDDNFERLTKEEIWSKYQDEIHSLKKQNEDLHEREKMWEQKCLDQQHIYEQSERQELLEKTKQLQDAELKINQQQETINKLKNQKIVENSDEVDALKKKLQSNKLALDAIKKSLDNEKAFRICAEEEVKSLKAQINYQTEKQNSLERDNAILIKEKQSLEISKNKVSKQCNELVEKIILLEEHCDKKEQAFDEQAKYISELEDNLTDLKENLNYCNDLKEEKIKLLNQIEHISRCIQTLENERDMYVQNLQKTQSQEFELQNIVRTLKSELNQKNECLNKTIENNSTLSYTNSNLRTQINNLQTNFSSCLQFFDEVFDSHIKINTNEEKKKECSGLVSILKSYLNNTLDLLEKTLLEFKIHKHNYQDSILALKDELNNKEEYITILRKETKDVRNREIQATDSNLMVNTTAVHTDTSALQNSNVLVTNIFEELNQNLSYVSEIKTDLIPKQKQLVAECNMFVLDKIKDLEDIYNTKIQCIGSLYKTINQMKSEIDQKDDVIKVRKDELSVLNNKLEEKNLICHELETELLSYRDNFDCSSTTSISRADEMHRMREIEDSQDERLQKLKTIAIKQKKVIADLKQSLEKEIKKHNLEKNELLAKLTASVNQGKLVQCLQQQYDIKCDEYDEKCTEVKGMLTKLKDGENQLLEQTNLCTSLKSKIDELKNDLVSANKTIKSLKDLEKTFSSKLEALKQEKAASDIMRMDKEEHVKELTSALKTTKDKIKHLESEISTLKAEKKKINIRDLELNSYEKTLDELSQKIKEEKSLSQNLEQELNNANSVIDSLHEQIKHLANTISTEQNRNKQISHQMELCRTGLNNAESLLNERENSLLICQADLDQEKALNKNLTDKYNQIQSQYDTEKEYYQSQHALLNDKIRRLQTELKSANISIAKYTQENQSLLEEFEAYKLRAHSVFQKHKQDTAYNVKVAELTDQLHEVTDALNQCKTNIQSVSSELTGKETEVGLLQNEVEKYEKRLSNMTKTLSIKDKEIYQLNVEIEKIKSKLEDEIRVLNEKILNNQMLYESEIDRLEQIVLKEEEARVLNPEPSTALPEASEFKLKKSLSASHIQDDDEIYSEFESSNESMRKLSKGGLMPLEDLLTFDNNISDAINELNTTRKQLKQLTVMLNETEKNCSRYEQQNKFLKEDIRRLQRSVDRNEEIKNMEYLKNIIFKFITLSNGVEKCHLVPVINKLLKLSPEEQKQIESIAKGAITDQNSSWSNLFTWTQGS
ncbi:GRIP and coiled-coil domain-containing protein 2-like isoform X2 [Adelges cooleyi]|uniref:GRIP and coiled-coil domain-containing protein 2-like isoform X2 n=1 Tax=Adelges cooleyi TaxID=133065 RepID=UPI00217FB8A3|nr:GRIP and coiled-coil domain-containing protein 2-like isoform X2 [Adelges cooleyi]